MAALNFGTPSGRHHVTSKLRASRFMELPDGGFMTCKLTFEVKLKNSMFQIRRIGTDILVVSPKYLDEIRKISGDNTRSVEPFIHDFARHYTKGLVFLESDLQNRVIQQKLTPHLNSLTSVMKTELEIAFQEEIRDCQGT